MPLEKEKRKRPKNPVINGGGKKIKTSFTGYINLEKTSSHQAPNKSIRQGQMKD